MILGRRNRERRTSNRLPVVIILGQSNQQGNNPASSISSPYSDVMTNARIFFTDDYNKGIYNGSVESLQFGVNNNFDPVYLASCGPELGLAYDFNNSTGKQIGIIKYSEGGSFLVDNGVDTRLRGIWSPRANVARSNGLKHYDIVIQYWILPAMKAFRVAGYDPYIVGVDWMQGEADSMNAVCRDGYEQEFYYFWDAFVKNTAKFEPSILGAKLIISRININIDPAKYFYRADIWAYHNSIAATLGGSIIDTDSYALEADLVHFTKAANTDRGIKISKILQSHFNF